jgi:hypothetical protein
MVRITRPNPCFLDGCEIIKVINGRQLWSNKKRNRFFTWDSLHGEIEAFDKQGRHLGALDAATGDLIKAAVPGRKIDV